MSDATLFPLSDPQQVLASLVRAFTFTPARRAAVCAWRALALPRVPVSAYAGGAVGLAPRVAVARAGDGNAAGGDDGNAGRDRRDERDERDTDAPGGGGGDGHPHDDRGGRTGGDGDGDSHDGERKRPGKKPLIILGAVLLVLLIAGLVWWLATRDQESTDDAYTDGNAVAMAPHVSGYVTRLAVDDNTFVHRGDVLVEIDPRDYRARVDAARAQLGLAQAQLDAARVQLDIARVQYPAQYRQARAQIESADAAYRQALAAQERQRAVDARATSQQAIDAADAQRASADANVAMARAQARTASLVPQQIRQAETVVEERRQQVLQARAQLATAELDLSYCELRAPSDGWVTRRNVQLGSYLQAGASVFSIVTPQMWITANFKESQLERMRIGDRVDVSVDAYPDLDLHGHVDSIQLGSGARFSAFPAENATGNFVKIVQRVPVKIVLDGPLPNRPPLGLGLSVEPTVHLK
ncbi:MULTISPECIES: HlyD family secretion protein [Burkholderia]|uniref:HlyD family secretion protein n=1 Tax=Burkholderia TaxID=32008 RepID=UPI0000533AFC|nr:MULTISPECIES: HlyD family secretion protein [Burkholderia]AJY08476.1 efflux transporter, RND family, MFP subunit [Burkholderia vietnamiensis LMG 10929]AOK02932.1 hemolysin D [Burkholderia vietnamiensis]AOK45369.1 hemolysin D [Burkholderia vietnamiensis]AVR14967.1 HlyD family secretion protein [Burkholderia vietnamiensis]KVE15353.1 hemolysin D [Burkholderia vietnamiensis]